MSCLTLISVIISMSAIISFSEYGKINCLVAPRFDDSAIGSDGGLISASRFKRQTKEVEERPTCATGVAIPRTRVKTSERLKKLRKIMKKENADAYIIPRSDEHNSEYTAESDRRRSWISGFDGSYGSAVVLKDDAAVWTDGRYFLQAEEQLDCNWDLMKISVKGFPNITTWLIDNLRAGSNVVADPKLISQKTWLLIKEELRSRGINMIANFDNFVDKIWKDHGRPKPSGGSLFVLDKKFTGQSWAEKIRSIRLKLFENEAHGMIIPTLDEVAWTFNLRGSDVPFNSVFKSYVFIARNFIKLYVDLKKVDDSVKEHLKSDDCTDKNCVALVDYSEVWMDLKETFSTMGKEKVLITSTASYALYDIVPDEQRMVIESPIVMMKAVKNPVEVEGMKNAHIRDSAVIVDFISSLEEGIRKGESWDEMKAAEELSKLRSKQQYNKGESFETISAFASNGAVIHYKPTHATNKKIDDSDMYLLDSGGQYLDGTTDITRTFHFGTPTDFHRETYTRVLMGAIDLAKLVFPDATTDRNIDNIARQHLHQIGLDYNHGTGHGIGAFLNIHERPTLVRKPTRDNFGAPLLPRMFLSDEPGYYEDRSFGVRLETIIMVTKKDTMRTFNDVPYYGFESVALVPFEPKLIKYELLTQHQIDWLNSYHKSCREVIGDVLSIQGKQRALSWLRNRTEPISFEKSCKVKKVVIATPQKQCDPNSASSAVAPATALVLSVTAAAAILRSL